MTDTCQYQPRTMFRPQPFGIEVDAAVAQEVVEVVQVPVAPRVRQVGLGEEHLFPVRARWPRDRPAGIADHQAGADEGLTALVADPVGAGDEHGVGVRAAHGEHVGHLW